MGSTKQSEPLRIAKENFHRQRLVWRVNPECNFLLLRRPPIFGFGRRKTAGFRSAPPLQKNAEKYFGSRKIFWGERKSYLAAEHHNEAAPKKKKKRFFRLGAEIYCSLGARRKSRFLVLGAEKKKKPPKRKFRGRKKKLGADFFLGGVEKVIWPPNTITRRRRKKKKKKRLGAEKYDFRPPKGAKA